METPVPTPAASEATITFHNEPWTAEGARLLLEVDEGWVGFRNDAAWSWHEETYSVFTAICRERKWSCNSQAACVAILHALRTGALSMQLNKATRSSDGHSQWSLTEMRELGAHMRRVVDGKRPSVPWVVQLAMFVEIMKDKDAKYSLNDRTVEDFAGRAGKYIPESILLQIDPNLMKGKTTLKPVTKPLIQTTPRPVVTKPVATTRKTRSNPNPEPEQRPRQATRGQAAVTTDTYDSDDEPLVTLMTRRNARTRTATSTNIPSTCTTKRRRKRSVESDGDSSHHDPTSEDEDVLFGDDSFQPDSDSEPATQEITSQGELLPQRAASVAQPTAFRQDSTGQARPSLPQDTTKHTPSATGQSRVSIRKDPTAKQASPREDPPASRRPSPLDHEPVQRASPRQASPREDPTAKRTSPHEDPPVPRRSSPIDNEPIHQRSSRQDEAVQKRASPRQDTADPAPSANGNQNGGTPTRQPSCKYQRVRQSARSDRIDTNGRASHTKTDAPHLFRSLNPYDRPGKPWGEFVLEVLLAERTARNEDELDYVQFVRGLYEI